MLEAIPAARPAFSDTMPTASGWHRRQHTDQESSQQVADAQQRQQAAGHSIGKPIAFLQQADHHPRTDGADAAEKEGRKARIAQTCALLFHDVPRFLPQGSFSPLNHNSAPAQPDFTPKAQKEGMDACPSLLSGFA